MNRPKYRSNRSETRLLESINRNDRAIKFGPTPQLALEPTTETRSKFSKLVTYTYIYWDGLKRDTLIKEKEDAMDVPSFEERFRIVDVWREFGGRFKYFSNFFLRWEFLSLIDILYNKN